MKVRKNEDTNILPLDNKYSLYKNKKIGRGAFGEVYLGINKQTKNYIAIKTESLKHNENPQLKYETSVLKYLQGSIGIPQIYFSTKINNYYFMIMELLGPNLESLLNKMNRHFSLKTIIYLGIQMINIIESLHKRHVIHRDIKPDNFVIGLNKKDKNKLYIIDFGLSKRFRNPKTGEHIPYKDGKSLTGTARYSSIYTHLGIEQSRRDDLEGMIYTLIYLFKGILPWQNLKAKNKYEKYHKILEKKMNVSIEKLCEELPFEFNKMLIYVRSLQFEEIPDYNMMKGFLIGLLDEKFSLENIYYDWDIGNNCSNKNNNMYSKDNKSDDDENIRNLKTNITQNNTPRDILPIIIK